MLLDLDNTLVDRDAAFRDGVAAFLREHGLPGSDLPWVMAVDAAGYTPRADIAGGCLLGLRSVWVSGGRCPGRGAVAPAQPCRR
ncbi:hypothetical protein GCM10027072_65070 [Streptomyces bullii]